MKNNTKFIYFFYSNLLLSILKKPYLERLKIIIIQKISTIIKKILRLIIIIFNIIKFIIKRILIISLIIYIKDLFLLSKLSLLFNLTFFDYFNMLNTKIMLKNITWLKNISLNLKKLLDYIDQSLKFFENNLLDNDKLPKNLTDVDKRDINKSFIIFLNFKNNITKKLKKILKHKILFITSFLLIIFILFIRYNIFITECLYLINNIILVNLLFCFEFLIDKLVDFKEFLKSLTIQNELIKENYNNLDNIIENDNELENKPFYKNNKLLIIAGIIVTIIGVIYLYNLNDKLLVENRNLIEQNQLLNNRYYLLLDDLYKLIRYS